MTVGHSAGWRLSWSMRSTNRFHEIEFWPLRTNRAFKNREIYIPFFYSRLALNASSELHWREFAKLSALK